MSSYTVVVHTKDGAHLADATELAGVYGTLEAFRLGSVSHWVPEFSTEDCELFQRALGVILDEARIYLPTVPPIVEIDSLEKSIRAFENWQGGLYE